MNEKNPNNDHYFPERHSGKNVKDSPYQCKVCHRCYVNDYSLKVHERIHTGIRPYSCHICKKEFFQSSNLKTHIAKHNSEKKFMCKVCNKRFMFEFDLHHHETCHDKEKALECVVCHKNFSHRGNLLKHEKIHTGVKRFACAECEKQFYDGSDLRKHLLVHSKEKPFECQLCNRKFSRHTYLKGHMSIHRNDQSFECDECFKVFSTRSLLRRHQARHKAKEIGIKPYYCEICDIYFSQTCSLKKHKKTPKHVQLFEKKKSSASKDPERLQTSPTPPNLVIQPPKTDKEFSTAFLALKTSILLSKTSKKSKIRNITADSKNQTLEKCSPEKSDFIKKKVRESSEAQNIVKYDENCSSQNLNETVQADSILMGNLNESPILSKLLDDNTHLDNLSTKYESNLNSVVVMVSDKSKLNIEKSSLVSSGVDIVSTSNLTLDKNKNYSVDDDTGISKSIIGECIKYFPSGVEIYKL